MRNAVLLALFLFGSSLCLGAEVYPAKPVRVIVPFAPGGTSDMTARAISQQLSEQLGKSFVVENRTGASGSIGNALVAKSPPDGYTLMLMDITTAQLPSLFKALPFDVARDFTPITQVIDAPNVLVIDPQLNFKTLREFAAFVQANPGKFNYGSAGVGTTNHLTVELFKKAANVNIAHIPYKGAGDALTAVMGGQVQMLIVAMPTILPHVKSGKLRALAVTTDGKRSPSMPDVPSMSEAGVSGMALYSWFGLSGPGGMPQEIVNKLHAEVVKAIAVPSVKERFLAQGAELVGNSPEEFSSHVRSEIRRWAEAIKLAGIVPE